MDASDLEVRCPDCEAGFAVGTRVCVHCQRPLDRRARIPTRPPVGEGRAASSRPREIDPEPEPSAAEEQEQRRTGLIGFALQLLFIFGVIATSFVSRCAGGE